MTEDTAQITPEWSPDGSQIAFSYAWNLWLVDTKGARVKPLTGPKDRLDVDYSNINVSPDISPDGTQIAYTSHKRPTIDLSLSGSSSQFEIKTAKIDGSSKRKLDKNGAFDLNPAWSPDGTRLAFLSDRLGPGQYHLFTMSADGSDVRSIAPSVPVSPKFPFPPQWSLDGARIAFMGLDSEIKPSDEIAFFGPTALYSVEADGSGLVKIGRSRTRPAWSPDGRRIAFFEQTSDSRSLRIFSVHETEVQTMLDTSLGDFVPPGNLSWHPEGAELLVSGLGFNILVVNLKRLV